MLTEQEVYERDALVMANARRLIKRKAATSNAGLYRDLFGTGHGTATARCRALGLDPGSNVTCYNTMMDHLRQQAKGGVMEKLTKQQAIIISGYTQYLCCEFSDLHNEIEKRLNRPVFTHELPRLSDDIQAAFKDDFLALCCMEKAR